MLESGLEWRWEGRQISRFDLGSAVDVISVPDRDDQNEELVILDLAEDAVIVHTIARQPAKIGLEGLRRPSRGHILPFTYSRAPLGESDLTGSKLDQ